MWSQGGEMGLLAGSTLGGGTVVNSMVCLRTPREVREMWGEMGLDGVAGPEFDAATDRVWERLGVNTEATHYNRNTELMVGALERLGHGHERIARNASLDDDPRFCGYCNNACQQGCKRSTLKTYLVDAAAAGARFLVDCKAERVLVEGGRAAGVEATVTTTAGETRVTVRAPTVVLAAGAMESPALLLRSGVGGPAVGRHLQLHPAWIVNGVYAEPVESWSGQIQSAVSFAMSHCEDDAGFLIESLTLSPALWSGAMSFADAADHRQEMRKMPHMATWHGVSHDPVDLRVAARAHVEVARMQHDAGAEEISTFHFTPRRWRRGEDFEAYLRTLAETPAEEYTAYTAHQMSSCRLGADPKTSVADGRGQLHDTPGVWVGDASALPTAPGVNPMISLMALAELTAAHMLEA
jgi:choline dehydrogenase-like flavoprotein